MNVTIEIPEERARLYQAQAEARGLTMEHWLLEVANEHTPVKSTVHLQNSDPDEWVRQFRLWLDSHDPNTPVLSDWAMSRDSIYPD